MASSITFKKADGDKFVTPDGRFEIKAERTESGYVRGWRLKDHKDERNNDRFSQTRTGLRLFIEGVLAKELSPKMKEAIEAEIKTMLHCCRDTMRLRFNNRYLTEDQKKQTYDPKKVRFDTRMGDYGEAFGVMRALNVLGFGEFGAINHPHTLNAWMGRLEDEVLKEEGFDGDGKCERCFGKYRRDDARPYGDEK